MGFFFTKLVKKIIMFEEKKGGEIFFVKFPKNVNCIRGELKKS